MSQVAVYSPLEFMGLVKVARGRLIETRLRLLRPKTSQVITEIISLVAFLFLRGLGRANDTAIKTKTKSLLILQSWIVCSFHCFNNNFHKILGSTMLQYFSVAGNPLISKKIVNHPDRNVRKCEQSELEYSSVRNVISDRCRIDSNSVISISFRPHFDIETNLTSHWVYANTCWITYWWVHLVAGRALPVQNSFAF